MRHGGQDRDRGVSSYESARRKRDIYFLVGGHAGLTQRHDATAGMYYVTKMEMEMRLLMAPS